MLYTDICMTQDDFEQMFDHRLYRAVHRNYMAEGSFPDVYDKVIPEHWLKEEMNGLKDLTSK